MKKLIFNDELIFVTNKTLSGEKLLVGIRKLNSFILIKKDYVEDFHNLYYAITENITDYEYSNKELELIDIFKTKGYFEGYDCKPSFNEIKLVGKELFSYSFKNKIIKSCVCNPVFYCCYLITFIITIALIVFNIDFFNITMDFKSFSIVDVILSLTLVPLLLNASHELAHYVVAKALKVQVSYLRISFFIAFPMVYLEYNGMNLNNTTNKLCILSAGILSHLINVLLGLLIYNYNQNNVILIWIMSNISMSITNMNISSPSDGYFFVSNLIGVYNLRYRGYLSLYTMFKYKVKWNKDYCGIVLAFAIALTFIAFYKMVAYYGNVFGIQHSISMLISFAILIPLIISLFKRIDLIGKRI